MQLFGIDLASLPAQLEPQSSGKVLLLDGDFLIYKAAATVKKLDTAVRRFYQMVLEEMFCAGCSECRVYITPTGCAKCQRFHLPTVKPYQGQRAKRQELPLRTPLKIHLLDNPSEYDAQGVEVLGSYWFEADDLLVMDSKLLKSIITLESVRSLTFIYISALVSLPSQNRLVKRPPTGSRSIAE